MPETTIYLDSNQLFRVFEEESAALFPLFSATLKNRGWKLILSDAHILEIYKGMDGGNRTQTEVRDHLSLMDSLAPRWLVIGGLDGQELRAAFSQYQNGEPFHLLNPFLSWHEFFLASSGGRKVKDQERLRAMSMPDAILSQYTPGCLADRSQELQDMSIVFRRDQKNATSKANLAKTYFIESVVQTCDASQHIKATDFAKTLWKRPEVCPAFRLYFEITVLFLGNEMAKWTTNHFFDQRHSLALPYVDIFVSADRGLRHAISEFDKRISSKTDLAPYCSRLRANIEDVL